MRDVVAGRRHARCATGVQGRVRADEGDLEDEEAAHLLSSVAPAMMWCSAPSAVLSAFSCLVAPSVALVVD